MLKMCPFKRPEIIIFDGLGNQFKARIESLGKKLVKIHLIAPINENRESPLNITIVQALTRMDKNGFHNSKNRRVRCQ